MMRIFHSLAKYDGKDLETKHRKVFKVNIRYRYI